MSRRMLLNCVCSQLLNGSRSGCLGGVRHERVALLLSPGGLQELGVPRGVVALEAFLPLVAEHKLSLQPVKKRCFGNDQNFFSPQVVLAALALAAARSRQ